MSIPRLMHAAGRLVTRRAGRDGGVVLAYHDVTAAHDPEPWGVTVRQLHQHLRLVRRLGFRFVTLADLSARAARGERLDGLAAVAFDDALAGVSRHALAVLAQEAVPATLMVVSTGWGQEPAWWPGVARTMTRHEVLDAVAAAPEDAPVHVAGHTRTHASLPTLGAEELREEVAGSRSDLEDLLGRSVDLFAYPFGHHDRAVRDAVAEAGFRAAFTFLNGRITGPEEPLRLPRLTMGGHHSSARLAYHLARPARSWPDHQADVVTGTVPTRRRSDERG